ncbi:uncharacterized protein BDR25DRAFT_380712 [Lindgomyces ingoldianus]|uniref:Uncharacterized protein n=1 Tax=Lindgomyces ingoldianus TaxID=673940 RepID=A0ACB6QF98_9PLEO|nr:uncharacterized protein BDR25DRAFT_380712 [Lindgomyces ingoldianus]KAF2464811.1 hypothetical protein BDR25DRAFT_380712 [Lindgomyces ingoldianus]
MMQNTTCPIAIIGMGCRLPGGANDPEKLWDMLSAGRDAWSKVPADRFNSGSFYHPNPDMNGTISHQGGHFLDQDLSMFDPSFFGISSAEAHAMDPQQRLQLETAYEALENAGVPLDKIQGSDTAVYMATFARDYDRIMYKDTDDIAKYHMTGTGDAILSNRVSYVFDLKGPSMTIDTGCSGSMVALHQACLSIQTGESSLALVGASNLILSPDQMIPMTLLHILNNRGRCFTFDARGSGYGRGEGAACLVLKRLDAALEDGDPIRAVIHGTGVNQDGKTSSGIAVPSQKSQETLAKSVYYRAGLDPNKVGYVEAHGTGTVAGDAIETGSISNVFCCGRNADQPLVIGSIKANIGHLESASGISGLIKTVLMLERGKIVANLNFEKLKPNLDFEGRKLRIARIIEDWPLPVTGQRLASVNSFGYGGTNGHAILASYQPHDNPESNGVPRSCITSKQLTNGTLFVNGKGMSQLKGCPTLLVLTAKSEKSLLQQADRMKEWAQSREIKEDDLRNLSYTLCSRRTLMNWRCSIVVPSPNHLVPMLNQRPLRTTRTSHSVQVAFVFSGQGAQWIGMGQELMMVNSKYMESLRKSDEILQSLGSTVSVIEELLLDDATSRINQSEIAQPAVTAIQIALVDLLQACGITPKAVLGHSSGEIAASYAAGALTHFGAIAASYHRAFVAAMVRCKSNVPGGMMAVGLGEAEVLELMSRMSISPGSLEIACVNSPESTTVSGDYSSILSFQSILAQGNIFNRILKVDTAYHSFHMKRVAGEYRERLAGLESTKPIGTIFLSSVTGTEKTTGFGSDYWVENLVSKVRFSEGLVAMCNAMKTLVVPDSTCIFIEIGPHSALSGPFHQTLSSLSYSYGQNVYISTLLRKKNAITCMVEAVGRVFELGSVVNFEGLPTSRNHYERPTVLRDLPPYSWEHNNPYWHESRISKEHRFRQFPPHDLLGVRVAGTSPNEPTWRNILSHDRLPWLRDHIVDNITVFPGSGYLCMAIEAMRQILAIRKVSRTPAEYVLRDISFSKALTIPESPVKVDLQLNLRSVQSVPDKSFSGWEEFSISSVSQNNIWTEHCRGQIAVEFDDSAHVTLEGDTTCNQIFKDWIQSPHACEKTDPEDITSQQFYEQCQSVGNIYRRTFSNLKRISINGQRAFGMVETPNIVECMPSKFAQPHVIHPSTLDTVFQPSLLLYLRHCSRGSIMPVFLDHISISARLASAPGAKLQVLTSLNPSSIRSAVVNTDVFQNVDSSELVRVLRVTNCELRGLGDAEASTLEANTERLITYRMEWKPDITFKSQPPTLQPEILPDPRDKHAEEKATLLNLSASLYIKSLLAALDEAKPKIPAKHHRLLIDWMRVYVDSDLGMSLLSTDAESEYIVHTRAKLAGVEGEIVTRTGPCLLDIVTGKSDPLAVMLEDNLLYRVYSEDSSMHCYSHLTEYLKKFSFKKPYLKVLEVGAGTGGTTLSLLEAHSDSSGLIFKSYDYTDISSGFFDHAHSKFKSWEDILRFRTLDIERDPISQGFEAQEYDLVVASNVIHATKFVAKSLANVRKLLKPGGKLALIETVHMTSPYMTTFGLLPGWWAGIDDGRMNGPLLSVSRWNEVLLQSGFLGTEIAINDLEGPAHRSSLIISGTTQRADIQEHPAIKFIAGRMTTRAHDFRAELITELESKGTSPTIIEWPSATDIDDSIHVIIDIDGDPMTLNPSDVLFSHISNLLMRASKILWITGGRIQTGCRNATQGLVTGLSRIARAENITLKIVTFDIQQDLTINRGGLTQAISKVLLTCLQNGPQSNLEDIEFVYRDSQLLIPRLIPDYAINAVAMSPGKIPKFSMTNFHHPTRGLRMIVQKPGLLDSLIFVDDENVEESLKSDEIIIQTSACGVNFKDVFISLGQMKPGVQMTGECAGIVTKVGSDFKDYVQAGDRVCAFHATPFASQAKARGYNVHVIPDSMSFVEAASIPVIFSTAYYGLIDIARLQPGQSVLIHSASGGVGQAAIKIAQHVGAEIYATVSTDAKRQLLQNDYSIPSSRIFSSRTRDFKKEILHLTQGRGVDVVLNSLAGEGLHASWSCVAPFGTFVEIGKSDIFKKSRLRMDVFDKNVTFASVDLTLMSELRPLTIQNLLKNVFSLFENGSLTVANPITTFEIGEIEQAFRFMQSGKHTGKVILVAESDAIVKAIPTGLPSLELSREGTYVVAGGLGDLGRHAARFLAKHGARNVLLLSRRKLKMSEEEAFVSEIQSYGSKVHLAQCDITNLNMVMETVELARRTMPPIRGVIQAAMVLQDRLIGEMTGEDFKAALLPKVDGTWNLYDAISGSGLDFFVMLSSLTGIICMKGQANYAAGNAFQDHLASFPPDPHTHFVSLNLGMIEDSDVIAKHPERVTGLIRAGCIPLKMSHFLSLLNYALSPQARLDQVKEIVIGVDRESLKEQDQQVILRNPMFSPMPHFSKNQQQTEGSRATKSIEQLIAEASTEGKALEVILSGMTGKIAALMAMEPTDIYLNRPIVDLGMDSLIAIELKNWIRGTLQVTIQTSEILDMPSLSALAHHILERSNLVPDELRSSGSDDQGNGIRDATIAGKNLERSAALVLPQLPLPELESSLNLYVEAVESFCDEKQLQKTKKLVSEFLDPNSPGMKLQQRLIERVNDPEIDAWQFELYTDHVYLRCRAPVNPFQHFGAGFDCDVEGVNRQAKQAAMVSAAAFEFKMRLESGDISSDVLNEQPLCMSSLDWIFNTTREPHEEKDVMRKFPCNDHAIVLRRGWIFQISLIENGSPVSWEQLEEIYSSIIDESSDTNPSLASLTADDRDSWARNRELLRGASAANRDVLDTIEACAFAVCLDDDAPEGASERWRQFLLSSTTNRWSDKSLQFVICENGVSGIVAEHSIIDGGTLQQLNEHICKRLAENCSGTALTNSSLLTNGHEFINGHTPVAYRRLHFDLADKFIAEASRIQQRFKIITAPLACEVGNYRLRKMGAALFRGYGCAPRAGCQILIQLAARIYFGQQVPSWETVSMRSFRRGRVDIVQTVLPIVFRFCTAALKDRVNDQSLLTEMRSLFLAAAQAHTVNVTRASRGFGFAGHLYALQEMRKGEEPALELFIDPTYQRTRPAKLMTDCTDWTNGLFQEGGWVMPDPEHVWIHYEVLDEE